MANEANKDKAEKLQEKMDDKNFELDIDALEAAAGGEYKYVDTYSDEYWEEQRRIWHEQHPNF